MAKDNPYIKAASSDNKKAFAWFCGNERPVKVCVSTDGGPEYTLNLKSLIASLEANGYTVTKRK